ncbi:MAG: tetratricopeptide repeat protein [Vampirovibrionales bacterium]
MWGLLPPVAEAEPGTFLNNWPKESQAALRQAIRTGRGRTVYKMMFPQNKRAASWITRDDLPDAFYWLGVTHEQGKHWQTAAQWYNKAAMLDHVEAQFHLALLTLQKKVADEGFVDKGPALLAEAAKQGLDDAQLQLAMAYEQGRYGFSRDLTQAVNWYRKAALQGSTLAQYALGFLYERGRGVPSDFPMAAHWYQRAGEQGLTAAQYRLGLMYLDGKGVGKDAPKARYWLAKAGEKGHLNAQLQLGLLYEDGLISNQDWDANYQEALRWYKKAANQGSADGQMAVGTFYLMGWGVDQDYVEAYRWLKPSAQQGNEAAKTWLKHLQTQMSKEELAQATNSVTANTPLAANGSNSVKTPPKLPLKLPAAATTVLELLPKPVSTPVQTSQQP